MTKKLPSARLLRRLIEYNPQTGEMWWKERPVWMFSEGKHGREVLASVWNGRYAGKPAGTSKGNGYLGTSIFKNGFYLHRIAFAISRGRAPLEFIDHINGDKTDNRIANLRDVSPQTNMRNVKRQKNNTSGYQGVRWHPVDRNWQALIKVSGRQIHLGSFASKPGAIAARKAAERRFGFHPNHGRA